MCPDSLCPLRTLLDPEGAAPRPVMTLDVRLTDSAEVTALRNQLSDVQAMVLSLRAELDKVTLLYGSESRLCNELVDICRDYGIPLRDVFQRHREQNPTP